MEIQFRALRDALDKAGRTSQAAEEATRNARAELHTERTKSSCFQFKVEDLTRKLATARAETRVAREEASAARAEATAAHAEAQKDDGSAAREEFQKLIEENKRLRTNVGELCQERDELKKLCKEYGAPTKPGEPAPSTTMMIGFENLRSEPTPASVTIG